MMAGSYPPYRCELAALDDVGLGEGLGTGRVARWFLLRVGHFLKCLKNIAAGPGMRFSIRLPEPDDIRFVDDSSQNRPHISHRVDHAGRLTPLVNNDRHLYPQPVARRQTAWVINQLILCD